MATAEAKVQALESQIEGLRPKKRKKVETSPNSKFANIKTIQKAQEEDSEVVISSDESSDTESNSSIASCIEVNLDVEEIED